MTNAPPIFYAVAQVVFNPVISMETFIDKIQERLRASHPDFTQETVNELQFHVAEAGAPPQLRGRSAHRWSFKNLAGTGGYLLTSQAIAVQTTRYSNSTEFIDLLIQGLGVVNDVVSLSYIESVGFRTLDVIIPQENRLLSFYLNQRLLGLTDELDGEMIQSVYQLTKKGLFGQLITRAIILNSQIGIPADLAPIQLTFRDEVRNLDGLHAVLDNDVTQQDRFVFSLEEAARRLRIVKEGLNDAFYKSLTAEGVSEWRK